MGFTIDGSGFHKEKMEGMRFEESIILAVDERKSGCMLQKLRMVCTSVYRCALYILFAVFTDAPSVKTAREREWLSWTENRK